ncbi:MAG: hypothetical protein LBS12_03130 [Prevotellaceae bacterium]|nr:hypothetical protein [Prevotellaceae bacterium]
MEAWQAGDGECRTQHEERKIPDEG